uniref:SET domain-containing protein n=1 Tax=Echinococcus granulosus TaxID=6210 RepID=A0A068X1R1_ECHGR|nr:hypothetical protein EgrG_002048900 [Echinococcus granulosus]
MISEYSTTFCIRQHHIVNLARWEPKHVNWELRDFRTPTSPFDFWSGRKDSAVRQLFNRNNHSRNRNMKDSISSNEPRRCGVRRFMICLLMHRPSVFGPAERAVPWWVPPRDSTTAPTLLPTLTVMRSPPSLSLSIFYAAAIYYRNVKDSISSNEPRRCGVRRAWDRIVTERLVNPDAVMQQLHDLSPEKTAIPLWRLRPLPPISANSDVSADVAIITTTTDVAQHLDQFRTQLFLLVHRTPFFASNAPTLENCVLSPSPALPPSQNVATTAHEESVIQRKGGLPLLNGDLVERCVLYSGAAHQNPSSSVSYGDGERPITADVKSQLHLLPRQEPVSSVDCFACTAATTTIPKSPLVIYIQHAVWIEGGVEGAIANECILGPDRYVDLVPLSSVQDCQTSYLCVGAEIESFAERRGGEGRIGEEELRTDVYVAGIVSLDPKNWLWNDFYSGLCRFAQIRPKGSGSSARAGGRVAVLEDRPSFFDESVSDELSSRQPPLHLSRYLR